MHATMLCFFHKLGCFTNSLSFGYCKSAGKNRFFNDGGRSGACTALAGGACVRVQRSALLLWWRATGGERRVQESKREFARGKSKDKEGWRGVVVQGAEVRYKGEGVDAGSEEQ
jgi:hypothetical protein